MHNVQRLCGSIGRLETESVESATEERCPKARPILVWNIRFVFLVHILGLKLKLVAHVELHELRSIRLGKRHGQLVIDRLNDDDGDENKLQVGCSERISKHLMLM